MPVEEHVLRLYVAVGVRPVDMGVGQTSVASATSASRESAVPIEKRWPVPFWTQFSPRMIFEAPPAGQAQSGQHGGLAEPVDVYSAFGRGHAEQRLQFHPGCPEAVRLLRGLSGTGER